MIPEKITLDRNWIIAGLAAALVAGFLGGLMWQLEECYPDPESIRFEAVNPATDIPLESWTDEPQDECEPTLTIDEHSREESFVLLDDEGTVRGALTVSETRSTFSVTGPSGTSLREFAGREELALLAADAPAEESEEPPVFVPTPLGVSMSNGPAPVAAGPERKPELKTLEEILVENFRKQGLLPAVSRQGSPPHDAVRGAAGGSSDSPPATQDLRSGISAPAAEPAGATVGAYDSTDASGTGRPIALDARKIKLALESVSTPQKPEPADRPL